ncbi:Uncharacterised protein [Proteus vulgaris]|nr:Uncharacterised protein [Proteus vulgaris]
MEQSNYIILLFAPYYSDKLNNYFFITLFLTTSIIIEPP